MKTSIRYVLLTALRDWLFVGMLATIVAAAFISSMLGSTAFLEAHEMTISFVAASSRLILAIGLIVFVCFHIRSAFDSKEIDSILSKPMSRHRLVLAYWLSFVVVALLLLVPVMAVLAWFKAGDVTRMAIWGFSMVLEATLVIAMAMFAAFTLKSAVTSVISTLGFYVLCRMMAFFVMTSESTMYAAEYYWWIKGALKAMSAVVPRLDFFAKSDWLVYGAGQEELMRYALQAAIYVPLLLVLTMLDFRRKEC
jgi:hypothetical protein